MSTDTVKIEMKCCCGAEFKYEGGWCSGGTQAEQWREKHKDCRPPLPAPVSYPPMPIFPPSMPQPSPWTFASRPEIPCQDAGGGQ